MHNFGTVFRFEVTRTLKKKMFWILAMLFPLAFGAVAAIIHFSSQATNQAAQDATKQSFSITVTDDSGLLVPAILNRANVQIEPDKQTAINAVKAGKLDAYFYYPRQVGQKPVEVYAKSVGIFNNSRYEAVAKRLLTQSVGSEVSPQVRNVLAGNVQFTTATYQDGEVVNGIQHLIAPGIFLVLFYLVIVLFGGQMLTSTTEEKENRVVEMIFTMIEPRALIVGKIVSLIVLGIIQVCIILVPVIAGYFLLRDKLALPIINLSTIPFDPGPIAIGAVLFVLSFLLFTGLLVSIGAIAPTAKEANSFFGIVMILIFGPLYAAPLFISSPDAGIVKFLSLFPFTAPIPLMLRNAVGNLSAGELASAIALLIIGVVLVMWFAVRAFRYGALEYHSRLSLKEMFAHRA